MNSPTASKYVQHQSCAREQKVNFIVHIQRPYGDIEATGEDHIVEEQVGRSDALCPSSKQSFPKSLQKAHRILDNFSRLMYTISIKCEQWLITSP